MSSNVPLSAERYHFVADILARCECQNFAEAGSGDGDLIRYVMSPTAVRRPTYCAAVDIDPDALQKIAPRLTGTPIRAWIPGTVDVVLGDCCHRDGNIQEQLLGHRDGFDAVISVEVIEHVGPQERLLQYVRSLFETFSGPRTRAVVITTPNRDCNVPVYNMAPGALRHPGHVFEWSRLEFETFIEDVVAPIACHCGFYLIEMHGIGPHGASSAAVVRRAVRAAESSGVDVVAGAQHWRTLHLTPATVGGIDFIATAPLSFGAYRVVERTALRTVDVAGFLATAALEAADAGASLIADSSAEETFLRFAGHVPAASLLLWWRGRVEPLHLDEAALIEQLQRGCDAALVLKDFAAPVVASVFREAALAVSLVAMSQTTVVCRGVRQRKRHCHEALHRDHSSSESDDT